MYFIFRYSAAERWWVVLFLLFSIWISRTILLKKNARELRCFIFKLNFLLIKPEKCGKLFVLHKFYISSITVVFYLLVKMQLYSTVFLEYIWICVATIGALHFSCVDFGWRIFNFIGRIIWKMNFIRKCITIYSMP